MTTVSKPLYRSTYRISDFGEVAVLSLRTVALATAIILPFWLYIVPVGSGFQDLFGWIHSGSSRAATDPWEALC